jgi:uncharacterized protein YndB with AHSA1/START domain
MSSPEQSIQNARNAKSADALQDAPVRKSVTVKASQHHAFDVFTTGFDGWWPRSHHIGKSPMTRGVIEGRVGGRCYSEQADGTQYSWGEVIVWDPPKRLVLAWKITPNWQYEPDAAKCSEVEISFNPLGDGSTRVDLEHRNFSRAGAGWETMRAMIDGPGGWTQILSLFANEADKPA